jgi:hypothetical protein
MSDDDTDTSQAAKAHRVLTSSSVGSLFVDDETQNADDIDYERRGGRIPDRELVTTSPPTIPAKRQAKEPDRYKPEVKEQKKPNLDIDIKEKELVDLPEMGKINASVYAELAHRISKDGLMPLIKAGLQHEIEAKTPIGSSDNDKHVEYIWTEACTQAFCQMDDRALLQAIAGNIAQAYLNSKNKRGDLAKHLDKLYERSKIQPSCYVRTLTDQKGESVSLQDLNDLMLVMHGYVTRAHEKDNESCAIDRCAQPDWTMEDSVKGKRHFLETDASEISVPRVKLVKTWCHAISERLALCTATNSTTLQTPLQYIGYALDATKRKVQHEGSSTSWFTELVKAACKVLFGDKYNFSFLVICLIEDEALGPWVEAILSRFMRAYATDGGFSIAWAGISTRSLGLGNMSLPDRQQFWGKMTAWIEAETPIMANIKKETTRRKAYHDKLLAEKKAEVLARIDKGIESQKDFVKKATRAHDIVERNRETFTREKPDLVKGVDKDYELALECQESWKRREAMDR